MIELAGFQVTRHEVTIINAATDLVSAWQQEPKRRPFREALRRLAEDQLSHYGLTPADYPAIRRVANLIRTRQGHPTDNAAPLIAAVRDHPDHLVTRE
jgi:uncharacterized protein YjiS (DUF1127 family)